jgi:hypothetical protein
VRVRVQALPRCTTLVGDVIVEMAAATAGPNGRWRSRCAQSVLACVGREKSACRKVLLLKLTLVIATTVRGNSKYFGDVNYSRGASAPGNFADRFFGSMNTVLNTWSDSAIPSGNDQAHATSSSSEVRIFTVSSTVFSGLIDAQSTMPTRAITT